MKPTLLNAAALIAPGPTMRWAARRFLTPRSVAPTCDEREVLATATRREMVPDGEVRLRAFVWGDEGPTVLLVHGWNGTAGQMAHAVQPLRRRGFRVVAYDAPAHGASEGAMTHVPGMARAVAAMARRFGPLHAIVGHSVGATAISRAIEQGLVVGRAAFIAPATGPRRWVAKFAAAARLSARCSARLAAAVEEAAGERLAALELARVAPQVDVPVLALHDRDDPLVPVAEARRAIRAMPHGRMIETTGLGHFRILRDVAVLREVAAFVGNGAPVAAAAPGVRLAVTS
jgi:pimeloyl-ACP methyl ester carboxylesterase